jgi:hypothetical protein
MKTAARRRLMSAGVASIAVHVAVLAVLALQSPVLRAPLEPSGPPEAVIPVLIMPRTPPLVSGTGERPAPIQLHRRPQPNLPAALPVPPLVIPEPKAPEAAPPAPRAITAPIAPPTVAAESVRSALRTTFGCSDAQMMNLSPTERARCLERLGQGAHETPYFAPALPAGKRAALEKAGDAKMAEKNAAGRPVSAPIGLPTRVEPQDYDGEPYITGSGASAIGQAQFPASKRAAKKLQPLPP